MIQPPGSLRDLARRWFRSTVRQGASFMLDRLLEVESVLEQDVYDIDDLIEEDLDAWLQTDDEDLAADHNQL